jgi:hypothetical protein
MQTRLYGSRLHHIAGLFFSMAFSWCVDIQKAFEGACPPRFESTIFYIFLTVHLRIILVGDQLDAQFLL